MSTRGSGMPRWNPPKHQADATLNQAAPVQNTWYTVLNTTANARIYMIEVGIATTGETLEVKLTIDGQTYTTPGFACPADSYAAGAWSFGGAATNRLVFRLMSGSDRCVMPYAPIEGRSVKVEVRKTTAAGAGNLIGKVIYAKW